MNWLCKLFEQCTLDEVNLVCMILWAIWRHRNDVLWNDVHKDPSQVVSSASAFLLQWQQAQAPCNTAAPVNSQVYGVDSAVVWRKPVDGYIKCNVDASVPSNGQGVGAD
ncbi:hypothetical protein P3X46_033208 [Hevea brasiliensis]|uniref:RNase H type-1 domain-containing protein n=1 Tax=Hevea brasiliensis TaxID=3981 RepID=A0ABQ9KGW8_HEVBR|nr:hypothetical protein P3X46_033208 [Hevea brasiliensis]